MRWLRLARRPAVVVAGLLPRLLLGGGDEPGAAFVAAAALLFVASAAAGGLAGWRRRENSRGGVVKVLVGFASPPPPGREKKGRSSSCSTRTRRFRPLRESLPRPSTSPSSRTCCSPSRAAGSTRLARAIVVASYVDTTVVVWAGVPRSTTPDCPRTFALIEANNALAEGSNASPRRRRRPHPRRLAILALRWRRATTPWRRVVAPVLFSAGPPPRWVSVWPRPSASPARSTSLSSSPTRSCRSRSSSACFASRLRARRRCRPRGRAGRDPCAGKAARGPRRALHDPSLSLAYWLPEQGRYVDLERPARRAPG